MGENTANDKYLAMRSAESKRAIEWMGLYTSNPELASSLIPIFSMPDEEVRFMLRMLNSLQDSLYFYKMATKPSSKKKSKKTTYLSV